MRYRNMTQVTEISGTGLLRTALILTILILLAACGRSAETDGTSAVDAPAVASSNYLKVTHDDYGLLTPNFYYSTDNAVFWSIQASVADSVYDQDYRCIIRIDVPKTQDGMPQLAGKTFVLGEDSGYETFPGVFSVFNGQVSVYKKVEQGTISFASGPDTSYPVAVEFDVTMTDYDSPLNPKPHYRIAGEFSIALGSFGPAEPMPAEVYPARGKETYDGSCASCHALGTYDVAAESGPDLALRGGELPMVYDAAEAHHRAVRIIDKESMAALRIFVNAW
ncbi:MAG: cytochrome c [Nitrospirota bacterium]|nr:cytochrome c [Nitrospirota bacterium]